MKFKGVSNMFVFNMKLDGNKTSKIFMGILCIIILLITFFICYKLIFSNFFKTNDDNCINNNVHRLNTQNYTNVLQNVHNNLDNYIGQKIQFSGYIYRLYDFSNEQFVLARNMVISSDFQTIVVGFLCHSNLASNYSDNTWVELTGTITKGNYCGEIPIIEVEDIKQINAPSKDEYVYPPDSSFVTTSTVL